MPTWLLLLLVNFGLPLAIIALCIYAERVISWIYERIKKGK